MNINLHRFKVKTVAVVAVGIALAATSSAEAAGFNVNSDVTFTPLASTYQTTPSTTGCPAAFSGKFTFTAVLTNKTGSPAMPGVTVRVMTLTNGNLLFDPQTNAVLGGAGAEMAVPKVDGYADGLLSPGESVKVPFALCLKTVQPFQFFVDVFGVVTQLVTVNRFGTGSSDFNSGIGSIATTSADGRFVAFQSRARDLVANDTNGTTDVFVRDLQMGTTTLVSVNRFGTAAGNGDSFTPIISADGRFVAFTSYASDLVANDTNGASDVFMRDLRMGTTSLVSVNRFGATASGFSTIVGAFVFNSSTIGPVISSDGRFVVFGSDATDLVATNDTNGTGDLFVRDMQMGTTTLVSVNRFGTASGNIDYSSTPTISADGRFVAFSSRASDLVANDANGGSAFGGSDVFVRDLQMGTTTLVSVNRFGSASGNDSSNIPAISADGRFVVFFSGATDLVANDDTNGRGDVFVRDLQMGTTTLVSVNGSGAAASGGSGFGAPVISAGGRFVVFESDATDLVANDTNGTYDVFVRDMQMGTTTLVSVNRFGTVSANNSSFTPTPTISADGRFVAFQSTATDLVANADTNGTTDVFVRDLQMGTTTLVSVNQFGTAAGTGADFCPIGMFPCPESGSGYQVISRDGRFVVFWSHTTDLVANDTNRTVDLFIRPVAP